MTTWRYTEPLHDALVEAITEEEWDADYKSEILTALHSVPLDSVIGDDRGPLDAEGNPVEVRTDDDADMTDILHPVFQAEFFGLTHLAELTPADVEAYRERHYGGAS